VTQTVRVRGVKFDAAADRHQRSRFVWHAMPVVAVGALLGVIRAEAPLGDSDVLWGARAGMDILSSRKLPHHATYSWTAAGRSWTPNSWGWDVILGAAYKAGGMTAIGVLDIAVFIAIGFALAIAGARIGAHPGWTAVAFTIVGRFILADIRARPQAVAYVMIFVLPWLLPRVLDSDRRGAIRVGLLICALQICWINLHSTGLLGPVLLGIGGVGLLVRDRNNPEQRERVARVASLVAANTVCCLATPYGTSLVSNVLEVRRASVGLIAEWEHVGVSDSNQILGLVAIGVGALCAYFAWRGRRYDTVAYLLLFAAATASAVRFTPMLFLLAIPEFALLLGNLRVRTSFLSRVVAAGCVVLAIFAAVRLDRFGDIDEEVGSPDVVAAVPHGCRLVNDYTIGGALMLARPDVEVSVDGRNDMYGRSLLLSVEGMLSNNRGTIARINANHVHCVLTDTEDKLVGVLEKSSNWRVVASDKYRTLLVRTSS
jgi:hypothetical protein